MQNIPSITNNNFKNISATLLSFGTLHESKSKYVLPVLKEDKFEKTSDTNTIKDNNIIFLKKTDCLDINDYDDEFEKFFPVLYHLHQISPENIKKIPDEEKKYAETIVSKEDNYMKSVHIVKKIAEALTETLNLQFGNNNYSILGIGRSPSAITQIMKLNGVKADSVPFTYNKYYNRTLIESDIDWKKYFAKFGFDEKTLTDKKKKTILTDFIISGASLNAFKTILDKTYPNNNVESIDLITLADIIPLELRRKYNLSAEDFKRFAKSLRYCDNKLTLCPCKHLRWIDDYKNYSPDTVEWPLLTKIILLDYLCKKLP